MENAIPTLVIGALLLVASAVLTHGNLAAYDQLNQSMREMEGRRTERAQSELTVLYATLDAGLDTLSVSLRNDGQTRLSDYSAMDLIVIYESAGGSQTVWLPFSDSGLTPGAWSVDSISDDAFEPGLLNPGEAAQLTVELIQPVLGGEQNRIVIVTDAGAITTAPFTS